MSPQRDASPERQHWCRITRFFDSDNSLSQCSWDPAQNCFLYETQSTCTHSRTVHSLTCFSMLQVDCDTQVRGMLQDRQRILEGCCQIVPSLKHAKVVSDWAGLRPARDRVRLELDFHQVIERHRLMWYPYVTLPSVIVIDYKQISLFAICAILRLFF